MNSDNPFGQNPWPPKQAVRPPKLPKERDFMPESSELDAVVTDVAATFKWLMFMGSEKKREYVEGNIPAEQKPQLYRDGVPCWSVQLTGMTKARNKVKVFTVTVPAAQDPAGSFEEGDRVTLTNFMFGARFMRNGRTVLWGNADSIDFPSSAGAGAPKLSAAAAS